MPVLIAALMLYARFKKVETMVALMRASGITDMLIDLLAPLFNALGIPTEVSELVLLRPFTGSGSYAILKDIYTTYGVDTYVGRCASVIMGTSETLFYVATVYFSQTSVKKLSYAIPLALVCNIFGTIVACLVCRVL